MLILTAYFLYNNRMHALRAFYCYKLYKKNPAKQDSPPAASRASDILPFRCSAIRAERFYFIGRILGQFTRNYTQTTKQGAADNK